MRKTIITILGLLIYSTAVVAQEHKERSLPAPRPPQSQTRPQDQPKQGIRYTSPEGRYTMNMPSQPELSSQEISAPDGTPMMQYMATAGDGTLVLMIAYFDYPPDVVFSLDKARDGMVRSINGVLVDEHSMSLGGAPGRQIKINARSEQGMEFVDRARFYDVRPRVYVLQCLVQQSLDNAAMADRCEQYFDSFRVRTTQ